MSDLKTDSKSMVRFILCLSILFLYTGCREKQQNESVLSSDISESDVLPEAPPPTTSNRKSQSSNNRTSSDNTTAPPPPAKPPREAVKPTDMSVFFNCCDFPLVKYPNPQAGYSNPRYDDGSFRAYGWTREGGSTFHGACDLWGYIGDPVYAVADGVVNDIYEFYLKSYTVDVVQEQECLIVRYAELNGSSIKLKVGDRIKKGDYVGKIANLGLPYQMVHFETFWNCKNKTGLLSDFSRSTNRREDIFDCTKIVQDMEKRKPKNK